MSVATLHYIHDPLCGWCYAAAPLLAAVTQLDGLDLLLHGGGLMSGAGRRKVTPELRGYVMSNDLRIAKLTGQPFGEAYFNGLLRDESAVFDSTPPIAAIMAAQVCGKSAVSYLSALQQTHFVEGRRIADRATLLALGDAAGIDRDTFAAELDRQLDGAVGERIEASQNLLQQAGGGGFPTFLLETRRGLSWLVCGAFLGQREVWQQHLLTHLSDV